MADGKDRVSPQAASRRLLNATAVMASGTLISRVLGFVKAGLLVIALGATTPQADTYSVATVVPNTLYMLVAGGALNTVLVPQIVRHAKNDADGGAAFINRIMTAFLVLLLAVAVLFTFVTPLIIQLWTEGAWRAAENAVHWQQLVFMAYLTMPQLFFYGAFFLVGQVLNARESFGPLMWAPILNNVVAISVLGVFLAVWGTNTDPTVPFSDQQVLLLGLGSTLGIIVQTLALIPAMRAIKFSYRPRWDLKGQGLGETFHLAKWMLGFVLLTSVVQIVNTRLGSGATMGEEGGAGVTAYTTAYLIWLLPHSLLTVSLGTALMPSASRLAASHDLPGVGAEITRTMRLALTFLVPAAIGFLVLGLPFSRLAFGHGATSDTWPAIGLTLMALAAGLIPFTIQYVYLRGFYVLEDTRSAFFIQLVITTINVVAAFVFIALYADPMTVAPRLGLAYGLSYVVGAWLTHRQLKKRLPALSGGEVVGHTGRLLLATLPGAALAGGIAWWSQGRDYWVVLGSFVGAVLLVLVTFFFVAKRLGVRETTEMIGALRRRGVPGASGGGAAPDDTSPVSFGDALEISAERTQPALLEYPEPSRMVPPEHPVYAGPHNEPGVVLDRRYRLVRALIRRGSTVTWLANDTKLSRAVLLHVMDPDEPRVLEILDQACRAGSDVDDRFLKVWDATLDEGGEHGSFIVCEYVPGQSLELALQHGPLSDVEAAWVVREVAAALVPMHERQLYHRQLNPDTVVVTASGNIKVVGMLVEHALHPAPAQDEDPEAADVRALGQLLYAALTGHWPGLARYGLRAAPTDPKGRPVVPRQVNRRASMELSDIADRILAPVPRGRATRLTTASAIEEALSRLLGQAEGAHLLEERLKFPLEPVKITAPKAPRAETRDVPVAAAELEDTQLSEPVEDVLGDDEPTGPLSTRADDRPASPWGPPSPVDDDVGDAGDVGDRLDEEISTQAFWLDDIDDVEDEPAPPFTPIPPPRSTVSVSQQAPSQDPPRRWMGLLLGLFALVLIASLGGVFVNQFNKSRAVPPTPAAPYALVSARDFDPAGDGGDGVENPDQVRYVMDGDPATAWTTERYGRSANFNGRKPGAGVIVDLGEVKAVSWVTVDVGSGPTSVDIRVPADQSVDSPPLESRDEWRRLDGFTASTGAVEVKLDATIETRWILVYITAMPRDGANYVGAIHEIRVSP